LGHGQHHRLIQLQEQLIKARKLAAEIGDAELARRLYEIADAVERRARELDQNRKPWHDGELALNMSVPREQQHRA
jgi:hypothetical protein